MTESSKCFEREREENDDGRVVEDIDARGVIAHVLWCPHDQELFAYSSRGRRRGR